jgi:hypothetical protein
MSSNDQDTKYEFRHFTVTGKVYSGNASHAKHSIYWALRNSQYDDELLIDTVEISEAQ